MRTRPAAWVVLGLILALALFLRTDSPTLAETAQVSLPGAGAQPALPVAYHGLRDSGVTIVAPGVNSSQTNIPVSSVGPFRVGQIVQTEYPSTQEIMEITGFGPGSQLQVTRGALGTTPDSHSSGTPLYSDFTRVAVSASSVGYRDTGATLTEALDTSSLDDSGALSVQSIGTSETTINISDTTLLTGASSVRFDGASYVSTVPNTDFLESTGRVAFGCSLFGGLYTGDEITYSCATIPPGEPPGPNGPNGSNYLAEVRLTAERPGTISFDLPNAKLIDVTGSAFFNEAGLGGSVTVVESAPPPPAPGNTCDGSPDVKVCIKPATQTVSVGEFSVYIVAQNVTNLGAFQFTLDWDPAQEDVTVLSVHRGFLKDDDSGWYRGASVGGSVSPTETVIPLNQVGQLAAGYTAKVGFPTPTEEMLILAVDAGPPASMTVVRGYNGTTPISHSAGAVIWAGHERMTVQRATLPSPHGAATPFRANLPTLRVSDHTALSAAVLQIDSERFQVRELPARTTHDTGLTLDSAVSDPAATTLPVSGAGGLLQRGWTLKVDDEYMVVSGDPGADTVPVARGMFGSLAASHGSGTAVWALFPEDNSVRVSRGYGGTSIASHAIGAPIMDVDGLGDYALTVNEGGSTDTVDFVGATDGGFLNQTGRTVACGAPTFGTGTISFACDTGANPLPLGPTGSGTLANVNVTATALLAFTPTQALSLSDVALHDVSGDDIPVSTTAGKVRVVKCPDVDNPAEHVYADGSVDYGIDVLDIARAALVPGHTQLLSEHDINLDGVIDYGIDALVAARLALVSQPQPLLCPF